MTETSKDAYVATGLGGQIVDIKDRYTAQESISYSNDTSPIMSLILDHAENNEWVSSECQFEISEDVSTNLGFTVSWYHHGETLYLGVASDEGTIYAIELTGGAAYGTIDLSGLPAGEYAVAMLSSRNSSVFASTTYQITS